MRNKIANAKLDAWSSLRRRIQRNDMCGAETDSYRHWHKRLAVALSQLFFFSFFLFFFFLSFFLFVEERKGGTETDLAAKVNKGTDSRFMAISADEIRDTLIMCLADSSPLWRFRKYL